MNLHDLFEYDPSSPTFLKWKVAKSPVYPGKPAGSLYLCGYYCTYFNKKRRYNHQIIWEMFNGTIPSNMVVDHIDRVRTNNCIDNLRLATKSESQCNKVMQVNNRSGYKGVSVLRNGKFRAEICKHGVVRRLGEFASAKEAGEAYMKAAKLLHKTFASDGIGGSTDPRSST